MIMAVLSTRARAAASTTSGALSLRGNRSSSHGYGFRCRKYILLVDCPSGYMQRISPTSAPALGSVTASPPKALSAASCTEVASTGSGSFGASPARHPTLKYCTKSTPWLGGYLSDNGLIRAT